MSHKLEITVTDSEYSELVRCGVLLNKRSAGYKLSSADILELDRLRGVLSDCRYHVQLSSIAFKNEINK